MPRTRGGLSRTQRILLNCENYDTHDNSNNSSSNETCFDKISDEEAASGNISLTRNVLSVIDVNAVPFYDGEAYFRRPINDECTTFLQDVKADEIALLQSNFGYLDDKESEFQPANSDVIQNHVIISSGNLGSDNIKLPESQNFSALNLREAEETTDNLIILEVQEATSEENPINSAVEVIEAESVTYLLNGADNSLETIGPGVTIEPIEENENNENYEPESSNSSGDSNANDREISKQKSKQSKKPYSIQNVADRKRKRNLGMEYCTAKGVKIFSRVMKPLRDDCRTKCKSFLSEDIRKKIFQEYWALGDHDRRVDFVASSVRVQETQLMRRKIDNGKPTKNRTNTYKYSLRAAGEDKSVCKTCFLNTLGETEKFVSYAVLNKLTSTSGVTHKDLRGKIPPPHKTPQAKIDEVVSHIQSFPAYKSHYSRKHTNKRYLSSDLTISRMYQLYKEKYTNAPVSITIYSREFNKLGLKFKKPKNDTCSKCDTLNAQNKYATTMEEKAKYERSLLEHQAAAEKAYEAKTTDKTKSAQDPTYKTYTFDLQQVLPTPYLSTNKMFYLRQLSTYNLTIHDCTNGMSGHFMWPENVASRGANEIASCLYRFLTEIPNGVETAVFYSDTCGGQNKNMMVISMFQWAIHHHPTLKVIEHKFLVPGHTHLECDVDHALIEREKKKSSIQIHVPRDWYQLVRNSSKRGKFHVFVMEQENFMNFSHLVSNRGPFQKKPKLFKLKEVVWLRYDKSDTVKYKNSMDAEENFKEISFFRKSQTISHLRNIILPRLYEGSRAITQKKKENLLEIVNLLDKDVQEFYINLETDKSDDTDPDIDRYFSEDEDD